GSIAAVGPREVVARQIEDWRARHRPPAQEGGGRSRDLEVHGVDVTWRDDADHPTQALTAGALDFVRSAGVTELGTKKAVVALGPAALVAQSARIELARDQDRYRVRLLAAESIDALVNLPARDPKDAASPSAMSTSLPVATALAKTERRKPKGGAET